MGEEITFSEYVMRCLDPKVCIKIYRERKHGKKTTNQKTGSKNKSASEEQTTSRTTTKPVS
jgi:hypothetical protein|tara:strand:+ start:206 stop:388 length:183 start_codon:yes stop_codon:yes gene_type:complete